MNTEYILLAIYAVSAFAMLVITVRLAMLECFLKGGVTIGEVLAVVVASFSPVLNTFLMLSWLSQNMDTFIWRRKP